MISDISTNRRVSGHSCAFSAIHLTRSLSPRSIMARFALVTGAAAFLPVVVAKIAGLKLPSYRRERSGIIDDAADTMLAIQRLIV